MSRVRIAVPIDSEHGLDSPISAHFGHCHAFLVSTVEDGKITSTETIRNTGHSSCADPINLLSQNGVDVLIASGMGMRPFMFSQQAGLTVLYGIGNTAKDVIHMYLNGDCQQLGQRNLCGGGAQKH